MRMSRRMGLYGSKKKYTWAKYNAVGTTTYTWKKYNSIKEYEKKASSTTMEFAECSTVSLYKSYSFDTSTGKYTLKTLNKSIKLTASNVDTYKNNYYSLDGTTTSTMYRVNGKTTSINTGTSSLSLTIFTSQLGDYSQGSTSYGTVSSATSSAYPTDGRHTDGYWYVSTGSTTTYSKGSTSYGTVTDTDPEAYPTNGRHTDGYWYVLQ